MDVKQKFLDLTTRTYPHGTESDLFHLLPDNLQTDEFGNKYIMLGEKPSCMFTCHLDTASWNVEKIKHETKGNIITTDGKTILGADDKAGCVVLLTMIENNVPGLYYFFLGEEKGCIGSKKVSNKHRTTPIDHISKVISFDRRGYGSVITHQLGSRCCSEEFGKNLSAELNANEISFNYKNDPTGIYTDSAQFIGIYRECTNISVGYEDEHSTHEQQDIEHLEKLCNAVCKVNWENLYVSDVEVYDYDMDDIDDIFEEDFLDDDYETYQNHHRSTYYFIDPIYNYKSHITISNKKILEVNFCEDRIEYEERRIIDLLKAYEIDFVSVSWNGCRALIKYNDTHTSVMYREELNTFIEVLDFWHKETSYINN